MIQRGNGYSEGKWLFRGDIVIQRGYGYSEETWLFRGIAHRMRRDKIMQRGEGRTVQRGYSDGREDTIIGREGHNK